jgi:3-oxoacyl-[acyl-carrier-protein] synthase III
MPAIVSVAAQLPPSCIGTDELLHAAKGRLSDKLYTMLNRLGVDKRYSVLTNFPAVLFNGAEPELALSGSALAAQAARTCIEKAAVDPNDIGLVLGITSSPSRLLPSLVCDLFALMPEIPRDAANMSISFMGCSAIAKVVDTASWFLASNPKKLVLACFMDSVTPLSPALPGRYKHFSEVEPSERQETVNAMHGFLFGDASVAMILSAESVGPRFGKVVHWTNDVPEDAELGTVFDGGSDSRIVHGRRMYTLSSEVTSRGTFYAAHTVKRLLESEGQSERNAREATFLLMHTGSSRILDGLCTQFDVRSDGPAVESSYRILRDFGNTIGCSIPLMLADPVDRAEGQGLVVAFGLSFSCGACTLSVPEGGWKP